jgi:Fe2+ or Zn2+ uptake regulation protein
MNKVKILIAIFDLESAGVDEFNARDVMVKIAEYQPEISDLEDESIESLDEKTSVGKSTVYRTLKEFKDEGILNEVADTYPTKYKIRKPDVKD